MDAAVRDADIRPGDSADVIAGKLRAAVAAHDLPLDSDFSRLSRFLAAGQSRRGTRSLRLLFETASGLRAARRIGPPPAPDTSNGREIRKMHRILGVLWAAAIAAAFLARAFDGGLRIVCVATAALLTALATAFAGLTYLVTSLLKAAGHPPTGLSQATDSP